MRSSVSAKFTVGSLDVWALLPIMHRWPKVAWVLLLTLLSDWLETTLSRDFTIKDIIYLHPSSTVAILQWYVCLGCQSITSINEKKKSDTVKVRQWKWILTWNHMIWLWISAIKGEICNDSVHTSVDWSHWVQSVGIHKGKMWYKIGWIANW